jgi:nucleotide-binding universal stress UspA family protein
MGSFAETLLLHSDIPTLMVGPHSEPMPEIKQVLFPTDFSEKSQIALDRILPLVKELGAKLILFHHFELFPGTFFPIEPTPAYLSALEKHEAWEKNRGERLVDYVSQKGVKVEIQFARQSPSTVDAILEFAKGMSSGMIAMASEAGPVGTALLGSVTRQVVRASPWPVWVLHPGARV